MLVSGFACEQSFAADSTRQITALALPGDVLNLETLMLGLSSQDVVALSTCQVGVARWSRLAEVLSLNCATGGRQLLARRVAIQREWLVCLGRRPALARIAHLICEILVRSEEAGLANGDSFAFPLRQADFADVLGLSEVHLNRKLQELRRCGLISWRESCIKVNDREGLESLAAFNPEYLRLSHILPLRENGDP
jgi:CRP-like cAMP-binding protein